MIPEPHPWMRRASCAAGDLDPEIWYSDTAIDKREAARICAACPVRDLCEQYATGERDGIWAGIDTAARYEQGRRGAATARVRARYKVTRAGYDAYKAGDRSATTKRLRDLYLRSYAASKVKQAATA